jgi:hypothetical protein
MTDLSKLVWTPIEDITDMSTASNLITEHSCQDIHMWPYMCSNRHQCFEPCGELGHDAKHAVRASKEVEKVINKTLEGNMIQYKEQLC